MRITIDYITHALAQKPQIGLTASGLGFSAPFFDTVDTLTKVAQCGAAVCGFIIAAWTLYAKIKKHRGNKS